MKFLKNFNTFAINEEVENVNKIKIDISFTGYKPGAKNPNGIVGVTNFFYDGKAINTTPLNIKFLEQGEVFVYDIKMPNVLTIGNIKTPITIKIKKSAISEDGKISITRFSPPPTQNIDLDKYNSLYYTSTELNPGFVTAPVEIVLSDGFELDKETLKPETIKAITDKLNEKKSELTGKTIYYATGASLDGPVEEILTKKGNVKRKDYDFNLVVKRYNTLKTLIESLGYKAEAKSFPKKEGEKVYGVYNKFNTDGKNPDNRNLVISSMPHTASIEALKYLGV